MLFFFNWLFVFFNRKQQPVDLSLMFDESTFFYTFARRSRAKFNNPQRNRARVTIARNVQRLVREPQQ